MNVCTIVAKNYLAHARVLARSLRRQHPDSTLVVLVLDDHEGYFDPAEEPFELIRPQDIGCDPFDEMVAAYTVLELSTAVKPWLLRTLLERDDHAVYLDPDIQVMAPLDEIRERAVEHGIVLTPHNLTPIPRDDRYPSEESILIAGSYNLGFIGLGRGDVAAGLLDWWAERLERDCVVDPASGLFVDQRWIDLVPGIWPTTDILRDPGYNIAYWNLHARTIEPDAHGRPTVDGRLVRFLHFSGYDPTHPERLSKHQDRIELADRPDVKIYSDAYGRALLEAGYGTTSRWPYGLADRYRGSDRHRGADVLTGVNVVGYLRAELGVGEVARQAIGALDTQGVAVLPVNVDAGVSRELHPFQHSRADEAPFDLNLICVNADMLPTVAQELGTDFFAMRSTVGWWWWEVDAFPEQWMDSFELVDEVWAGSRFVADALRRVSPVPVAHIPTPVSIAPGIVADRRRVGLPEGFVFLFVFDFNSVMARKNPGGVVDAFLRAFPEPATDRTLVLKTINDDRHPEHLATLHEAIGDRADIIIMDGYLDADDKDVLIAGCDCYVSLHRSEGFGLTLAEAMLLNRPVIATDYAGSTDFVSDDTGFPVRCELVPIGPGAEPYPAGGHWAEPDLDHAAELMRRVVEDPEEAAARAARGREFVRRRHSPAAAGAAMRTRLRVLRPPAAVNLDPPTSAEAQRARTETLDVINGEAPPAASGAGRRLQRLMARLTRPMRGHQREVDEALWWSVETAARYQAESFATVAARLAQVEAHARATVMADRRRSGEVQALSDAQAVHELELGALRARIAELESALGAERDRPTIL